jgi:hypothetical protein
MVFPRVFPRAFPLGKAASAKCCTSDITLADFKTLCAKMDASVGSALTAQAYQVRRILKF